METVILYIIDSLCFLFAKLGGINFLYAIEHSSRIILINVFLVCVCVFFLS